MQSLLGELSRDSVEFHQEASRHADVYANGDIDWSLWIDHGWPEFVAVVYWLFGKALVFILLINVALAAWAAVLVYRIARVVFHDEAVAHVSALLFGLFPSIVYYTTLPLKEAPAVFALTGLVWGILKVKHGRNQGWVWIVVSLAILAALRVYLFYVCLGCLGVCLVPVQYASGPKGVFQIGIVLASWGGVMWTAVALSGIDTSQYQSLQYFDVEYINHVRVEMSVGNTELYDDRREAKFSGNWLENLIKLGTGIYYFFVSIDLLNITRARQYAAIPEIVFMVYCLPYLISGAMESWRRMPSRVLPVLLLGTVLILVYTSAATNMGALYRWRVQAMPFVIMIIVYGAAVRRKGALFTILQRQAASAPAGLRLAQETR